MQTTPITAPNYDVITLNRVTFNLADRMARLEDAMVNVVKLQIALDESIAALESKLTDPDRMN